MYEYMVLEGIRPQLMQASKKPAKTRQKKIATSPKNRRIIGMLSAKRTVYIIPSANGMIGSHITVRFSGILDLFNIIMIDMTEHKIVHIMIR